MKKAAKKKVTKKSVLVDTSGEHIPRADIKPRQAVAKVPENSTVTDQLIAIAIDKDLDMDKLERLITMRDNEEMKGARTLFNLAMARVQAVIEPIIADADNDHTGSKYSRLCSIVGTLAPIYGAEGFSCSFGTASVENEKLAADGWFRTTAELAHAGGYYKEYFIDLPLDIMGSGGKINKTKIHGTKSTITYARGILMGLMFNFTTSLDMIVIKRCFNNIISRAHYKSFVN